MLASTCSRSIPSRAPLRSASSWVARTRLIPAVRPLRRPPGVIVHTRPDNEDIATVWRDGLPLTAPARALLDVADGIQPEQLSMAVRQALRRALLTADQLREEAERRHKQHAIETILSTETSA